MAVAAFVLDKKSILDRLGGDEDIYSMMVDMYLQDVDANCAALAESLAAGDAERICREVHTVKGLLATFSDEAGAADAQRIEDRARVGDTEGVADAVAGLQARLREVAGVLGQA